MNSEQDVSRFGHPGSPGEIRPIFGMIYHTHACGTEIGVFVGWEREKGGKTEDGREDGEELVR